MAYDPDNSGEYIRPLPQYMDNLIVSTLSSANVELLESNFAWDTAQLRNYKMTGRQRGRNRGGSAEGRTIGPAQACPAARRRRCQRKHPRWSDLRQRLMPSKPDWASRRAQASTAGRRSAGRNRRASTSAGGADR